MHKTFDHDVPVPEQLMRTAKRVGRKHNHKPSSRITERRKAGRAQWVALKDKKAAAFKQAVHDYWAGALDTYPVK